MSNSSLPTLPVPNINITHTIDRYSDSFSLSVHLYFRFSHLISILYNSQPNFLMSYYYYNYYSSASHK